jgi:hypothetical protein
VFLTSSLLDAKWRPQKLGDVDVSAHFEESVV